MNWIQNQLYLYEMTNKINSIYVKLEILLWAAVFFSETAAAGSPPEQHDVQLNFQIAANKLWKIGKGPGLVKVSSWKMSEQPELETVAKYRGSGPEYFVWPTKELCEVPLPPSKTVFPAESIGFKNLKTWSQTVKNKLKNDGTNLS